MYPRSAKEKPRKGAPDHAYLLTRESSNVSPSASFTATALKTLFIG